VQNLDYLPFGEINSSDSGISGLKFTGDMHDSATNLEHTWFRQYSSQLGRWMTPDPAGLLVADPSNPQSWNRYAYVLNNPLKLVDPFGLDCVFLNDHGDGIESVDQFAFVDECIGDGGYFVDGTVTQVSISADTSTISLTGTTDGFNQTGAFYQQFGSNLDSSAGSGIPADGCGFSYLNGSLLGTQCGGQFTPYQPSVTDGQRIRAVAKGTKLAGGVIPTICGPVGIFGYAGKNNLYGLVEYDSKSGLSAGGLLEGGSHGVAGGLAGTSTKGGLSGEGLVFVGEGVGAFTTISTTPQAGPFVGGTAPGTGIAAGVGVYGTITSVNGCHE